MTDLQIVVDGHWLSLETYPGDIVPTTIWPGGSDQLTWTDAVAIASRRFVGGEDVRCYYGGVCTWGGSLLEPDASTDQLVAQGAWREGDGYTALDGTGAATDVPDTAVDVAIGEGLRWTRNRSLKATGISADITTPIGVGALLDIWATNNNLRWGVTPNRVVYGQADPTFPTYQTLHREGGIGYATDAGSFASTLDVRYYNPSSVLSTVRVTDPIADRIHRHQEAIADITDRGPMSTTTAQNIGKNLLALGKATPQYTETLDFTYGELLTMGGVPVALETVAAGVMLRVNGGYDLAQRGNGDMFDDIVIGQTSLEAGVLTVTPLNTAFRSFEDAMALAIQGR